MTFEEWYKSNWESLEFATRSDALKVWNAAKEDSKPETKAYYVECFHGGVNLSYWWLVNLVKGHRQFHFRTKKDAEKWAIENGYRIKDS